MNPAHNDKPVRVDAFVLYSFSTPTHEKIEIEKYIVGFLKLQHFKVISCNDHTEKTIMQWVEENARLAHVVFICLQQAIFLGLENEFKTSTCQFIRNDCGQCSWVKQDQEVCHCIATSWR